MTYNSEFNQGFQQGYSGQPSARFVGVPPVAYVTGYDAGAAAHAARGSATGPYSTIGPYKSGVWLVSRGGAASVVDKSHLPPQGSGAQYYWLGSTPQQANSRILDAFTKLGVTGYGSGPIDTTPAFNSGIWDVPHVHGLSAWLQSLGDAVFIPPLSGVGAALTEGAAGATGATGAADSAAVSAGGGSAAANAANAARGVITGAETAVVLGGIWQFLTTPASWLRILKYIAGAVLIFFALKELTGVQTPAVVKRAIP